MTFMNPSTSTVVLFHIWVLRRRRRILLLFMKSAWPSWRNGTSGLHPFAAMMVGLPLFCPLRLVFPLSSSGRRPRGLGALLLRAAGLLLSAWWSVSGRCLGELTALSSVSPQQEGLDDGPDFLSEEDRGVSVHYPVCLSVPVPFPLLDSGTAASLA